MCVELVLISGMLVFRSYPDLHKTCVDSLKKILMSSCMGELFTKCHKELLQAVGDCFLMETIPMESLQDIWKRVLGSFLKCLLPLILVFD